jgi:hypothetical protein
MNFETLTNLDSREGAVSCEALCLVARGTLPIMISLAVLFDAGEEGEFGGRGEEAGFDGVRGEGAELVGAEAGGRGQISVMLGFAGVGWRGYTTQLSENFRGTKPCAD